MGRLQSPSTQASADCGIKGDMTRGVLFDLYGVVMRVQTPEAIAAIERAAGFGGPELWEPYWAFRAPYDHGLQSARDYWARVAAESGRRIANLDAVIAAEVAGWSRSDDQMVGYVCELARRCPVGVLSDVPIEVIEMLERSQPWIAELPSVTLSARVGIGKPDARVFRLAVAGLGLAPGDVLFTDDRPGHVEAARSYGLRAVVFKGLAALRPVVNAHLSGLDVG